MANGRRNTPADIWAKIDRSGGPKACWPWLGARHKPPLLPYGKARYNDRDQPAHRVAFELHHGRVPVLKVLHSCDNPPCCNPKHLFEGTAADNSADMISKGRHAHGPSHGAVMRRVAHRGPFLNRDTAKGERNAGARLTAALVAEVRFSTESQEAIARRLGVTQATISKVRTRRTWKHLP